MTPRDPVPVPPRAEAIVTRHLADPADKRVVGWRAWYVGRRVFDSDATEWTGLPDDGVLIVILRFANGHRQIMSGDDWYFHDAGADVWGHNSDPLEDNAARYPNASFKRGRWESFEEYERAMNEALTSE